MSSIVNHKPGERALWLGAAHVVLPAAAGGVELLIEASALNLYNRVNAML